MKIRLSGVIAYLEGNWTFTGVKHGIIDALSAALQKVDAGEKRALHIDCRYVTAIDTVGLQLLYGWMECARLRGLETELVNLPNMLSQPLYSLL